MPFNPSFVGKTFVVSDSDARIRNPINLTQTTPGVIPQGSQVLVSDVKTLPTGSKTRVVFGHVTAPNGTAHGWTSTRNFDGKFVNETIGLLPSSNDSSQTGPNAAWVNGEFLSLVDLVEMVDNGLEIERMTLTTLEPYLRMVAKADADGVHVAIVSGFRSFPEQTLLFQGFQQGLPGFNLAAKPGFSNHQNGIALDIDVGGSKDSPIYKWLGANATSFGFVRTVNGEPWHWELNPAMAATARRQGVCTTPNVSN
jgi:hypothetical protein